MKRQVNLMSIAIVTNNGCNLRCNHCYVEEDLLSSKIQMKYRTFEKIYERLDELVRLEDKMVGSAIETLGGEITLMPFEFWEKALPLALSYHEKWTKLKRKKPIFTFCTNLIISDERYYGLFEKYKDHPAFELFVSFEEDTGRYGSRNKLLKKYFKNLEKTKNVKKTINLIPTKHRVSQDIEELYNNILEPYNFDDVSNDMMYQFGSGKKFFKDNQPKYIDISEWYIKSTEFLNKKGITSSPREEIIGSIKYNKSFHCMGNDAYDLQILDDGVLTLNSSMTGSESINTVREVSVFDDLFAAKIIFENTNQYNNKINFKYDFCDQCDYLTYCNSGYYHHRMLNEEDLESLAEDDCPGFKKTWEYFDRKHKNRLDKHVLKYQSKIKDDIIKNRKVSKLEGSIKESDIVESYDLFIEETSKKEYKTAYIENRLLFGKTVEERLWYYDSQSKSVIINDLLNVRKIDNIIFNFVYDNFNTIEFSDEDVLSVIEKNIEKVDMKRICEAAYIIFKQPFEEDGLDTTPSGLKISDINSEVFTFICQRSEEFAKKLSKFVDSDFKIKSSKQSFFSEIYELVKI